MVAWVSRYLYVCHCMTATDDLEQLFRVIAWSSCRSCTCAWRWVQQLSLKADSWSEMLAEAVMLHDSCIQIVELSPKQTQAIYISARILAKTPLQLILALQCTAKKISEMFIEVLVGDWWASSDRINNNRCFPWEAIYGYSIEELRDRWHLLLSVCYQCTRRFAVYHTNYLGIHVCSMK